MANNRFNKQVTPKGYKMGGRVSKMGGGMMKRPMYKTGGKAMGSRTGFDEGQRVEAEKRDKKGYKHRGTLEKAYKEIMGEERKMPSAKSALFALTPTDAGAKFVKGLRKKGINVKKIEEDILKEKMKSKEFRIGHAKSKLVGKKVDEDEEGAFRVYKKGGRVAKKMGGSLKPVDPKTQKGLSKLPTEVRNKMGFMKKGGKVK